MKSLLIPLTTILTPNSEEARKLSPAADGIDACAVDLLHAGCRYVLITGTHENTPNVINTLYSDCMEPRSFNWERLSHTYHGSGCTLAAAVAGLLALGATPEDAVAEAQRYTWTGLQMGFKPGKGQYIPNRNCGHWQS